MILLWKPEPFAIRLFLDEQLDADFNYPEVGATQRQLPRHYAANRTRAKIGQGLEAFLSAVNAIQNWQQLQLGWVYSWPQNAPLRVGENIAVVGRGGGVWWVNACRVIYTEGQTSAGRLIEDARVFGYAVGTLQDHLLCGEERYTVEIDEDDNVWAEIIAFSRPHKFAAKLAYPMIRNAQSRFGQSSVFRMQMLLREQSAAEPPVSTRAPVVVRL